MKESVNHPIHYTIFKPNNLIKSDRSELKGVELAVYNEILNNNHKETPEVLVYRIPYARLREDPVKNATRDKSRLGKALQSRSIYFDEQFSREFFGEKYARSITPFPKVVYKENDVEVHLSEDFKKVLTVLDLGFTKGDIETLRNCKHDISSRFYWHARQKQAFKKIWEVSVADFKKMMFVPPSYDDWRNLKRKVIELSYEDLKGTWMEFEWEEIKTGKKITSLKFIFKNGPKEELDSPVGNSEFNWEGVMLKMGVHPKVIKEIRQTVRVQSETDSDNGKIFWDSHYIDFSIEAAREQYNKQKSLGKTKIKNLPAWFISGLHEGRWMNEVETKRRELRELTQGDLFKK